MHSACVWDLYFFVFVFSLFSLLMYVLGYLCVFVVFVSVCLRCRVFASVLFRCVCDVVFVDAARVPVGLPRLPV